MISRRTQPYRSGTPRMPGMALQAMLAGRQPGVFNGGDFERMRRQRAARGPLALTLQDYALQQLREPQRPRAMADVRGNFPGIGGPVPIGGRPAWEGIADGGDADLMREALRALGVFRRGGDGRPIAHAAMTGDPRRRPLVPALPDGPERPRRRRNDAVLRGSERSYQRWRYPRDHRNA